jgi:hypothetical protein
MTADASKREAVHIDMENNHAHNLIYKFGVQTA